VDGIRKHLGVIDGRAELTPESVRPLARTITGAAAL
jgi:hypothetical protein